MKSPAPSHCNKTVLVAERETAINCIRISGKYTRPLVKSAYQKNNFLISQPKHMLWVLKRTVSMRRFF